MTEVAVFVVSMEKEEEEEEADDDDVPVEAPLRELSEAEDDGAMDEAEDAPVAPVVALRRGRSARMRG